MKCRKILVIEDDPAIRDVLIGLFRGKNHDVLVAKDGRRGLELAGEADCIFMNLDLPGINGEEVIRRIRKGGNFAPIIVVSGAFTQEWWREKIGRHKVVDFIEKPFTPENALKKLEEIDARVCENMDIIGDGARKLKAFVDRQRPMEVREGSVGSGHFPDFPGGSPGLASSA